MLCMNDRVSPLISDALDVVLLLTGTPVVTASHGSDPDLQIIQGCWGDARILLTPEAIYAAHLYTNQAVLVREVGAKGACGNVPHASSS